MIKVIINGAYDMLHVGHINLINFAKSKGDHLLVALDTDERVKKSKGFKRPVNDLLTRMTIMKNIREVNEVRSFGTDGELIDILIDYKPDYRVIGSDWKNGLIVGREYSGELIFYERNDERSTTKTLENYINRR